MSASDGRRRRGLARDFVGRVRTVRAAGGCHGPRPESSCTYASGIAAICFRNFSAAPLAARLRSAPAASTSAAELLQRTNARRPGTVFFPGGGVRSWSAPSSCG